MSNAALTRQSRSMTTNGLTFLWLEVTGKCNLTCSHCYADSGPTGSLHGSMSRDDWFNVICEAADLGCRSMQFIGGEPTIHPDLPSLIEWSKHHGFSTIEVFTNSTRLDQALLMTFRANNVTLPSSFYSCDQSVHDRITGVRNSWHRTVAGFRSIREAGLPLRVGIIEMGENAGHVDDAKRFLNAMGIGNVRVDRLRHVGRGGEEVVKLNAGDFGEHCGQCWKGRLCITHAGTAFPCVFARSFPMGDVRQGLRAIVESRSLEDFRVRLREDRRRRESSRRALSASTAPDCIPDECNPDNECSPDCSPNEDCGPKFCHPDSGGCSPNDPSECGPDK